MGRRSQIGGKYKGYNRFHSFRHSIREQNLLFIQILTGCSLITGKHLSRCFFCTQILLGRWAMCTLLFYEKKDKENGNFIENFQFGLHASLFLTYPEQLKTVNFFETVFR